MPDKNEKDRRKQLLDGLNQQAREAFESSLPMSRDLFQQLFDYLDEQLGSTECDDTYTLTKQFLSQSGVSEQEPVLQWLSDHGAYCDCEILNNVEEQFD